MLTIRSRYVPILPIAAWLITIAVAAQAGEPITGALRVTDGDTVTVAGTRIRLFGIDAPELAQRCTAETGTEWRCGVWARDALSQAFGGQQAVCQALDTDRYGRTVARCKVAGADIAEAMVSIGAAEAYRRYSDDYIDAEKAAIFGQRGIWSGEVEPPWEFRASTAPPPQTAPKADCAIKGNISASGRIYHLPGQRDYDATRISATRGERWFCSEAEALAAGWRRALR